MAQSWTSCTTSIDQVQKLQYKTTPLCGLKRSIDDCDCAWAHTVNCRNFPDTILAQEAGKRQCLSDNSNPRLTASKINRVGNSSGNAAGTMNFEERISLTPCPSQNPLLSLAHPKYGLPETLVKNFASLGVKSMYPWQSSCLLGRGLLEGTRNLVYTAPTGGGKSLIADILMFKTIIECPKKKAILVVPCVALVQEKLKWLRKACEGIQKNSERPSQLDPRLPKWRKPYDKSVRVVGFYGGSKSRATWSDFDIAVCTIEKVVQLM